MDAVVQALYDADESRTTYGFVDDLVRISMSTPDCSLTSLDEVSTCFGPSCGTVAHRGWSSSSPGTAPRSLRCAPSTATVDRCGDDRRLLLDRRGAGSSATQAVPDLAAAVLCRHRRGSHRHANTPWRRGRGRWPAGRPSTTEADVKALRDAGWDEHPDLRDDGIHWLADARSRRSTPRSAPSPDAEIAALASPQVLEMVTWGRPVAAELRRALEDRGRGVRRGGGVARGDLVHPADDGLRPGRRRRR